TSISSPADVMPGQSALMTFLFGPPPPPMPIAKPYGLALKNGKLYISDTFNGTIHIADLRQKTWDYFHPKGAGKLRKNIGVFVDNDGTLYVSDTQRGQVVIFDAAGKYTGELGHPGELKPTAIEIADNRLYIADMKSQHVLIYDKSSHAMLESIPKPGVTNESERLFQPVGLARDQEGRLYVSDIGAFRIQVYNADGSYLRTIGRHGDSPGEFVRNKGIALDREHRLYSVDAGFQILQLFDAQDRILMYFGEPDEAEGQMFLPADVIVDYDNVDLFRKYAAPGYGLEFIVLVSNQYGDRKINVYGFLRHEDAKTP
ncbi:MAG: 6-bladed beta-propeller, partial [bacterium]